jgi:ABC-type nitrate/sulfonate/bicarbonate transport system permease component
MAAGPDGPGRNSFDSNVVWAATLAAVVVAMLVDRLLATAQSDLSRWQPSAS